jgi:hypothetical protein
MCNFTTVKETRLNFSTFNSFKQINDTHVTLNQMPAFQKWFILQKINGRNVWRMIVLVFGSTAFTDDKNLLKISQAIFEKKKRLATAHLEGVPLFS